MARAMGILGQKLGMTQVFVEDGSAVPVTVLRTASCVVLQRKTPDNDGYCAVQLGLDEKPPRTTNRPDAGHFAKAKTTPKRFVREVRLDAPATMEPGQEVRVDELFKKGDRVDVIGTSKGKGFQGVMRRHNFSGFRASHGTHEYFRHSGAIGCRLTPGRVHKGKRMPGHMGHARSTSQNLLVVAVDAEQDLLLVRGAIPGPSGAYVLVRGAIKAARTAARKAA